MQYAQMHLIFKYFYAAIQAIIYPYMGILVLFNLGYPV